MKAYILAAGIGSRLYPLTETKPKCLVRVHGRSILEYQIEGYLAAGLRMEDIVVVAGYESAQVLSLLDAKYPQVTMIDNAEYMATNNMFSLYMALQAGKDDPQPVLISNGDCIYSQDILKGLVAAGGADLVAADQGVHIEESMKITVNDGTISRISKETGPDEAWGVSIDLYSLSPDSVAALREIASDYIDRRKERKLWTEVALQDLFGRRSFAPFDIEGKNWVEIDNIEDLRQADRLFADFNLDGKRSFVVDLDGTVYLGRQPIEPTIKFITDNSDRFEFYFLTNNTSKTPPDYVDRLQSLGINTDIDHILSPYTPLVDYLKTHEINRIFLLGNSRCREYLSSRMPSLEFTGTTENCQAVVVAYDTELTYEKLRLAALLLQNTETKFLATHCDKVCPTEEGPIPDIGSMLALLQTATGRVPDMTFGKPNPGMLDPVRDKHADREIVVVGDRLYTDKKMADEAGLDFVLVLSGESKRQDVEALENFPRHIVDNLGELT